MWRVLGGIREGGKWHAPCTVTGCDFLRCACVRGKLDATEDRSYESSRPTSIGSDYPEQRYPGFSGGLAVEDCRARRGCAGAGGPVPGFLCRVELTGAAGWEFVVFGADGIGQDAHCGSGGGDLIRGFAFCN